MDDRAYLRPAGVHPARQPFTHVIRVDRLLFIAGQVAFDPEWRVVGPGDPARQAEQCWKNIDLCLRAAGGTTADIVKVVCFLVDMAHAPFEAEVRRRMFPDGRYPTATLVQVARLFHEDFLMEIDVTAVLRQPDVPRPAPGKENER